MAPNVLGILLCLNLDMIFSIGLLLLENCYYYVTKHVVKIYLTSWNLFDILCDEN